MNAKSKLKQFQEKYSNKEIADFAVFIYNKIKTSPPISNLTVDPFSEESFENPLSPEDTKFNEDLEIAKKILQDNDNKINDALSKAELINRLNKTIGDQDGLTSSKLDCIIELLDLFFKPTDLQEIRLLLDKERDRQVANEDYLEDKKWEARIESAAIDRSDDEPSNCPVCDEYPCRCSDPQHHI